ncbi:MAG: diiron oxygenase [Gammaproteobacteria bacterium]
MTNMQVPIFASPENLKVIGAMIGPSHRDPMKLEEVLPWEQGIDRSKPPKLPEASWLYGTPYWDQLTEAQRLEVLWLENARDVSNFITLEQYLPPIYMGYLAAFGQTLAPEIEEYMMIFSKEEIIHTMMFRRYMEQAGLPSFVVPPRAGYDPVFYKLEHEIRTTPPIFGVLWTVLLEWSAELNAMHGTQSDGIDPFTRKMFRQHHIDEVRHIAFGQRIVEDFFKVRPDSELDPMRALLKPALVDIFEEFKFTEQICDLTSFKFPFDKNDTAAIASVRNSENNTRLHHERFKEMTTWLEKLGLA